MSGEEKYLKFRVALQRNFLLWFRGMGLSIPFVSLITLITAHSAYTDKGITSWDEDCETTVHFKSISTLRFFFGILIFISVIVLNIYLIRGI